MGKRKRKAIHFCTCGSGFHKAKDLKMHLQYMRERMISGHKPIGKMKESK